MQEITYLTQLSWLSLLLIGGIIISLISLKLKIPDILLLIIFGVIVGQLGFVSFETSFLSGLAIFALIMILFDSSSKFKPKEVNTLSPYALKLSFVFMFLCLIILTLAVHLIFKKPITLKAIIVSAIFASVMSGTSPDSVMSILKDKKNKLMEMLQLESIINTPLMIIVPIMLLDLYRGALQAGQILIKFLQSITTGVGTGLVIGLIIFKLMKKKYLQTISPLVIIGTALITYTLSEYIGGNGVLAVSTLGLVYGFTEVKEKIEVEKFSSTFTNFLKIIIFILLGLVIKIPFDNKPFLIASLILFLVYLVVRYTAVTFSFRGTGLNLKEKIFMGLSVSKGVAVAVIAFTLASLIKEIEGLALIVDLSFLFILYSIVVGSLTTIFSKYLVGKVKVEELKTKKIKKKKK